MSTGTVEEGAASRTPPLEVRLGAYAPLARSSSIQPIVWSGVSPGRSPTRAWAAEPVIADAGPMAILAAIDKDEEAAIVDVELGDDDHDLRQGPSFLAKPSTADNLWIAV